MRDGSVTRWAPAPGGGWDRSVARGVRVEEYEALSFGAVQPLQAGGAEDGLRVYAWPGCGCSFSPGDYLAVGDVPAADPSGAGRVYRVATVRRFTLGGSEHHAEVTAR